MEREKSNPWEIAFTVLVTLLLIGVIVLICYVGQLQDEADIGQSNPHYTNTLYRPLNGASHLYITVDAVNMKTCKTCRLTRNEVDADIEERDAIDNAVQTIVGNSKYFSDGRLQITPQLLSDVEALIRRNLERANKKLPGGSVDSYLLKKVVFHEEDNSI